MKRFLIILLIVFPATATAQSVPPGFVVQSLEPTGGEILRPKDWFYNEAHSAPTAYRWTISREDYSSTRHYDTGLKIQAFFGIKRGTGKTAEQFMRQAIMALKQRASVILKDCEPQPQGMFTRQCLETEEGPYHILYSFFWDTSEIGVITTAGAPKDLWANYAPIFDTMSAFKLMDGQRLGGTPEAAAPSSPPSDASVAP